VEAESGRARHRHCPHCNARARARQAWGAVAANGRWVLQRALVRGALGTARQAS